jgi:hypothetical protein
MKITPPERISNVLRIGHDTSMRGEGISLNHALRRADYVNVRKEFEAQDLVPYLRAAPELVEQWWMYSEDKRTSGGWWIIKESREVGGFAFPDMTQRFDSLEEAVAEFIVRELDFWATFQR